MNARGILEELERHKARVARPVPLPTEEQIAAAEAALHFTFPPSYRLYQMKYSNLDCGRYEPWGLTAHGPGNLVEAAPWYASHFNLPDTLIPFMEDDGDFLCFDLTSDGPEYRVVLWSEDSHAVTENWDSFADWVHECWVKAFD